MSDGVAAAGGAAGADGGDVPGVAFDDVPNAAPSLPLLPNPLDSELTADDLEILCALPDNDANDAAASSVDASALPASPEPSQAPAAESSPLLLGQALSSEMSGASDPWLPTPSPHEEIGADAEANPAPAYVEGDRGRDSLSTPSPSPHNDHSYTAPASPADTTADEGENVGGNRDNVNSKNVGCQESAVDDGENVGSDRNQKPLCSDLLLRDVDESEAADAADGNAIQPDVCDDVPLVATDGQAKDDELHPSASAEATVATPIIAMEVDDDKNDAVADAPSGSAPGPVVACEPAGGVALDCGTLTSPNLSLSASAAEGCGLANRREDDEGRLVISDVPSTRASVGRVGVSTRRSASSDLRSAASAAAPAPRPASAELKKSAGADQFACDQCSRSFPLLVNLRRHVSNAHNKLWLKCNPPSRQGADANETGADGIGSRIVRCVCCSCRRSFRSLTELRLHRKSCGIVGGLTRSTGATACSTCGRRCVSAIALLRHLQSHRSQSRGVQRRVPMSSQASSSRSSSQPRPASSVSKVRAAAAATTATTAGAPAAFECRRCGDSLPDMKSFIVHMETHSSEPAPYECSPTEGSSGSGDPDAEEQDSAAASVGSASSESHLCDQCGRTFRCLDRLQLHIKRHEAAEAAADDEDDNGGNEPRLCEKCGKEVSSAELLERHMAKVHGDDIEDKEKGDVCGDVSSLLCVVKVEAPEPQLDAKQNGDGIRQPSWECPSCSARFATELELKRHVLKHRPSSSATVSASGGDAHSVSKKAAKLPSTTTTGLRPGVGQPAAKDRGRGEKRRERQCRRCGRHFSRGCSLRRHELAEHPGIAGGGLGTLPTCHKCGRQFRARQRLREHLASVHSRPQPSCSVCGLRFTSAARLCWHVEQRHGDAAEERRPQQRRFAPSRPSSLVASGSASKRLQQRMYRCRHCVARFRHAQQLWLHSLRRHSPDIVRTGLGVVRGLEICGKAGKTLPLHRLTMWHSCLHCMARYRQLESLWRHTRLSHRDRLLDIDGTPLLPAREPRSLQGDDTGGGEGSGNVAKLGSPSAAARGSSSGARKLPIVTAPAPVHAAFVSTAEQSKQLIARNFKIAPGGRESLTVQQKPQTAASHDLTPSGGSSSFNPTAATENRRYNHRDQQRPYGIRSDQTTLSKPAPIGEMQKRAEAADATKGAAGGVGVGSRHVSTRATRAGDNAGASALADRRPVAVIAGGGSGAAATQHQEQEESQYYSAAGRALRRSVLQRAAKATDGEKSAGTPVASSSTAAHSGSDSTESSPGVSGSKPTLSTAAALAASRRPVTTTVLPTLRQQAMCLWCDATFPRLAMLAEHACVHREELQKIILETIGKRT